MTYFILIVLFMAGLVFLSVVMQDPCHLDQNNDVGYVVLAIQYFGKILSLMNPRTKRRNVPRCEMLAGTWLLDMNVEKTELSGNILLAQVVNEAGLSGEAEIEAPSSGNGTYKMRCRVRLTYQYGEWLLVFTPYSATNCRQFEFLNHSFMIRRVNFDSDSANIISGYVESRYTDPAKFNAVRK